ncbi:MAG: P-type conjugative transfer protein TrbG [Alphaproteobacteria bacterium]|nr:P-type conjugative transfer protein TrbG [Alphaproteobacteria bacterium]
MTTTMSTMSSYRGCLAAAAVALLAGCVHDQKPVNFVRAVPQEPPRIEATIAPGALPAFQQKVRPIAGNKDGAAGVENGLPAIEAARKDALIASAPDGFINATQYFAYEEGALYELHAASGFLSTIQLQPGEQLVNIAAGDTARWAIGDVTSSDRTIILVKPTRPDLTTNLVITTDQRVYLVEATSHDDTAYNAIIAWTYPFEDLSRQIAVIEAENERRDETVVTGVPVDQLDFNYGIDGDKPGWRPIRAFNDGSKTYIEFPEDLGTVEAPPLFLTDDDGSGQLVNYRVKQNYYVVDRLFDRAELRLDGTVVGINKTGSSRWASWFGGSSKASSRSTRGCTLCRDPDDHGDNDRSGHDSPDHEGVK